MEILVCMIRKKQEQKTEFEEADDDLKNGRVYSAQNAQDLFDQLMSNV